jgi:hypothetical protein
MGSGRITGLVLLALGVVLLVMGITATDSVADQFSRFFTGEFTDSTMWMLIGGVVSTIVGLGLTFAGAPRETP